MTRTILRLAALAAMALASFTGCEGEKLQNYTVVSEIVLGSPKPDMQNLSATLSAIYNGDDSGIDNAYFTIWEDGQEPASARNIPARLSDGTASATAGGLELGKDYRFNLTIITAGGNTLTADSDGYLPFSQPHDFVFSTVNTVTAKILQLSYSGSDDFIAASTLVMKDADGLPVENVPEMHFYDGTGKALFVLADWEQALFTVYVEMEMLDGTAVTTPTFKFSTMPLPETLTLGTVGIDEGTFSFSASYDGEDNTITRGYFTFCNAAGEVIDEIDAVCADRTATASSSGNDYGRYSVKCTLELVDGSTLEAEPVSFTYSRPRAYTKLSFGPAEMAAAGMSTTADGSTAQNKCTYLEYDWEYLYIYARPEKGDLYISSSYAGFIMNADSTPFENGIKAVYVNHTSGRDPVKYLCYGKTEAGGEWVKLPDATKEGDTFIYDLSMDNYRYFKFGNKSKAEGGGELRAASFDVEYYTEAPEEY